MFTKLLSCMGIFKTSISGMLRKIEIAYSAQCLHLLEFLKWSQNTVRRVINTLKHWGIIDYSYTKGFVKFLTVRQFNTAAKCVKSLITKLCNVVQRKKHIETIRSPEPLTPHQEHLRKQLNTYSN